jgi:hypothetical protein
VRKTFDSEEIALLENNWRCRFALEIFKEALLKKAEEAIFESEQKISYLTSFSVGIYRTDASGNTTFRECSLECVQD